MTEQASDSPGKPRKTPKFTPEDYRREAAKWVVFPSDPHREDTERMRAMLDAAAELAEKLAPKKDVPLCKWCQQPMDTPTGPNCCSVHWCGLPAAQITLWTPR